MRKKRQLDGNNRMHNQANSVQNILMQADVDFDEALTSDTLRPFYAAWKAARTGGNIPRRADIRIQDFADHMSDMVITERRSEQEFFPRLTGGAVDTRMSGQLSGANILDLHCDETRPGTQQMLNTILDRPCGVITEYSIAYPNGKHMGTQVLMLPVRDDAEPAMIISVQRALGKIRMGTSRETPVVGLDYAVGQYIDLGFGLPPSGADCSFKMKQPQYFTSVASI